jgi:Tol biopolymer transport system component/tRNA A-37 threonylcarbamoyl transferase component Bud32
MIGKTVGSYKISSKLGEGGMGAVYRATDTRLGRDVAIKFSAEKFSERFEREARAIAALNHPNICTLYDVGPDYLVMELVEGEAPKGPMPLAQALDIGRQIADALKAAHEKGIIHRDLKPDNLRITPEGKVKVLDFGLARMGNASQDSSTDSAHNSPTLMSAAATQAGIILGTASYMSPEQARGKTADRRADIWAFGVVLYELLTGRSLFEGESVSDTIAGVLKTDPDWTPTPPRVRRLLKRCLERDPAKRLQDIGDVWDLLDETPVAPSPTSRRVVWPVIAVAALLATVVMAAIVLRPKPLPEVIRFQIAAPAGSRIGLGTPAPSPDGRSLAYVVIDSIGVQRLYLRRLDRSEPQILAGTEGAVHPFWSPDGRSLAFVSDNIMKRFDIDSGMVRVVADRITGPWHGDWNSKGDILGQMLNGIVRLSDQGAAAATLVIARNPDIQAGHPAFLDDQRFFFRSQTTDGAMSIRMATMNSKDTQVVVEKVDSAPLVAATPGGKTYLLYIRESDLVSQELDPASGSIRGEPSVLIPGIGRVANPAVKPAVGVSGKAGVLAYQTGLVGSEEFTWFDRTGQRKGAISTKVNTGNFRLSPNESFLAYRGEDGRLWILDIARGSTTSLTDDTVNTIVWSPDGTKVAFRGLRNPGISIANVDGTGEETVWDRSASPRSWSADGILFTDGGGAVFLLPQPGSRKMPELVAPGPVSDARLSPDGKFIAVDSIESGRREIYIQPLPPLKGRTRVSVNGGRTPHWRRDGKELYFLGPDSSVMAADVTRGSTISAGVPHQLFRVAGGITGYDIQPDGHGFLIVTPSATLPDNPITVVMNWWVELKQ